MKEMRPNTNIGVHASNASARVHKWSHTGYLTIATSHWWKDGMFYRTFFTSLFLTLAIAMAIHVSLSDFLAALGILVGAIGIAVKIGFYVLKRFNILRSENTKLSSEVSRLKDQLTKRNHKQ